MITVSQIMAWGPCPKWPKERVRRVIGRGRTIEQILRARRIPHADRIWVACHKGAVSDRVLRLFACDCAERALRRERRAGREPDPRSWEAVRVARRYADGDATAAELAAAGAVAGAVAEAAASSAARAAAAWAAAWAAWEEAWVAAWEAAHAAAWEARETAGVAWVAAWEADCRWQCTRLLRLLREEP